jgi:hypothetical protein
LDGLGLEFLRGAGQAGREKSNERKEQEIRTLHDRERVAKRRRVRAEIVLVLIEESTDYGLSFNRRIFPSIEPAWRPTVP